MNVSNTNTYAFAATNRDFTTKIDRKNCRTKYNLKNKNYKYFTVQFFLHTISHIGKKNYI